MNVKIYRAGLLPYVIECGEVKFLFMKPSNPRYGGDRFQIAKGKIETGETPEVAAIREASEELGLVPTNIGPTTFLGEFLGRTSFFIAPVLDRDNFNTPCFETSETAWLSLDEFDISGRTLHLPIIRAALMEIYRTAR